MDDKKNTKRVAIYARTSTLHNGQDIGLQTDELKQVAAQRGWEITGEYLDEGISGGTAQRPGLDRLLKDASSGKIDLLFVWRLDRLARSLQHLLHVLDALQRLGVGFISLRDSGIDTTCAHGRLMLQILGAFGEFERCLIQERVRAGVDRAKRRGVHCGRPKRELDLRAARELLGNGHSLGEVAAMLDLPKTTLWRRLREAEDTVSKVSADFNSLAPDPVSSTTAFQNGS